MMSLQLIAVLFVSYVSYHGVHGEDALGFNLNAGSNCVGNDLESAPKDLNLWSCSYDCQIDPQCAGFVLEATGAKDKCYLKSSCDTFSAQSGFDSYTKVDQWDSTHYTKVDDKPDCTASATVIMHGKPGDAAGCTYACDQIANCVGIALYDDGTTHKRCNVELGCGGFSSQGDVYSKGARAPPVPDWTRHGDADCWFNDLATDHKFDVAECASDCLSDKACVGYVTNDHETECWPKYKCNQGWALWRTTYKKNPELNEVAGFWKKVGSDCWWNDIAEQVADVDECHGLCKANPACNAFITNNAGTYCWLKSACGVPLIDGLAIDRVAYRKV